MFFYIDILFRKRTHNPQPPTPKMPTFQELVNSLQKQYPQGEAKSIIKLYLEKQFSLTFVDVCLGGLSSLDDAQLQDLERDINLMKDGVPVQYVLGTAEFYGRDFKVEEGVLIPRPETEGIVEIIKNMTSEAERNVTAQGKSSSECAKVQEKRQILDIGCGSGCISVTLALETCSQVTAWDISDTALKMTKRNAEDLSADVSVERQDALQAPEDDMEKWDFIVSNPPYICKREAAEMEKNVLEHEPSLALFVPDDDPLLFYRAIAEYGLHALKPEGALVFEINEAYGPETAQLMMSLGYSQVQISKDIFEKERFVYGKKKLLN